MNKAFKGKKYRNELQIPLYTSVPVRGTKRFEEDCGKFIKETSIGTDIINKIANTIDLKIKVNNGTLLSISNQEPDNFNAEGFEALNYKIIGERK